jgi:hypothetical protein
VPLWDTLVGGVRYVCGFSFQARRGNKDSMLAMLSTQPCQNPPVVCPWSLTVRILCLGGAM